MPIKALWKKKLSHPTAEDREGGGSTWGTGRAAEENTQQRDQDTNLTSHQHLRRQPDRVSKLWEPVSEAVSPASPAAPGVRTGSGPLADTCAPSPANSGKAIPAFCGSACGVSLVLRIWGQPFPRGSEGCPSPVAGQSPALCTLPGLTPRCQALSNGHSGAQKLPGQWQSPSPPVRGRRRDSELPCGCPPTFCSRLSGR